MSNGGSGVPTWLNIAAGLITGFAVSPTNAILDRSVIEYANGKQTVREGVRSGLARLFTSPIEFFTSYKFRWMYFVYAVTYTTNNLTDHSTIIPDIPIPLQNLVCTFIVNTVCGILKDKAYIQHFGVAHPKVFPAATLGLLFLRDIITVASAFTLPHVFAESIHGRLGVSEHSSLIEAQLLSPLLVQILVTPLHLLGLDLYNREGLKIRERFIYLKGLYRNTLAMRMVRFMPAYGIGGVINH
jgi:hypothetical protein